MREKLLKLPILVSALVIVAAMATLSGAKSLATAKYFLIGSPRFVLPDTAAMTGAPLGSIRVLRGHFYLVRLQSEAAAPFTVFFSLQDSGPSKALIVHPEYDEKPRDFASVIKADGDDDAARVTMGDLPDGVPHAVRLRRFSVTELSHWFYTWRAIVRVCAMLALLAAVLHLAWRLWDKRAVLAGAGQKLAEIPGTVIKPQLGKIRLPTLPRAPAVVCWALLLVVTGAGFDLFFLEREHSHLFQTPFQSSITGWDGPFYYFWLRSVMVDGDVNFKNDLLYCDCMPLQIRLNTVNHVHGTAEGDMPITKKGLIPNKYPIGWAVLEVPWYLAGSLSARILNLFGNEIPLDGWQPVYQVFLILGQVAYMVAGLYFSYEVLTEYMPPAPAVCGVITGWLGAPLFYYQTLNISMAHNVMFFSVAATYCFTLRLRKNPANLWNWFLVGIMSAFVILSRYQGAVMLLFPVVVCLQEVWKNPRRYTGLMVGAVSGFAVLSLQVGAWKWLYGVYFLDSYQGESFDWKHAHYFDVLFSSWHGFFNWTPVMLVGVLGFGVWAVTLRRYTEAVCFAISLTATWIVNGAWSCWWFGAAFGLRAFDCCTLFVMLGLGFLFHLLARRTAAFHVAALAILLLCVWNMNLIYLSQRGRLSIGPPITWKERIDMSRDYWLGVR